MFYCVQTCTIFIVSSHDVGSFWYFPEEAQKNIRFLGTAVKFNALTWMFSNSEGCLFLWRNFIQKKKVL